MSKRFSDPDFEQLCVNFWQIAKAHQYGGPRLPPSFSKVLNQGSMDYNKDYPLNPYFPAFVMVVDSLEIGEQIAFYAIYIGSAYRLGKKVPIKVIANEIGVNRSNFYKKADRAAKKAWLQTKAIMYLYTTLYSEQ